MLSPLELSIVIIIAIGLAWWWRIHGQRDYALGCIKEHCKKLDITLLDDYVALKRITLKRDSKGIIRLTRIYGFEFTVTGEQRYTGTITLFGYHVGNIDLQPYPFIAEKPETVVENKPSTRIIYLERYKKDDNGL